MIDAVLSGLGLAAAFTAIPVVMDRIKAHQQGIKAPSLRQYGLLYAVFSGLLVAIQIEFWYLQ